jgi:hypothetical protein
LNLKLNKPVYTIVSSAKANFSQMKFISLKTGGEMLNLGQNLAKDEVKKLLYENLKFMELKRIIQFQKCILRFLKLLKMVSIFWNFI